MKKKIYIIMVIICSFIVIGFIVIAFLKKQVRTDPYGYLVESNRKSHFDNLVPSECLSVERVDDNNYIIFYLNNYGNIMCALIKKSMCFYKILGYSGEMPLQSSDQASIVYSYFREEEIWINWGVVFDDTIKTIMVNGKESNIININKYDIRICYFLDDGMKQTLPPEINYLLN